MRILFLNPIGQLGGAERSLLDLIRSLREHDPSHDLSLISFAEGPLVKAASALGIEARVVPLPSAQAQLGDSGIGVGTVADFLRASLSAAPFLSFLRRLRGEIRELSPHLIHSNGLKSHLIGAWTRPSGAPLIWHLRDFLSSRRAMRRLLPVFEARVGAVICNSEAVAQDTRTVLGRAPLFTVLNGIQTQFFADESIAPADLDALSHLPAAGSGTVRVGLLATHASWKGHTVFLDAARRITVPGARFYVVSGALYTTTGSETDAQGLRRQIATLGLEQTFGLVPFQEDPRAVYRALDIVVNASTRPEPFGRTIAEALAAGRTVVAPAAGGILEQISDGVTGRLYPPGDAAALADVLTTLLSSREERARLSRTAGPYARARLDAARLGPEVMRIYRQVRGSQEA